MNTHDIDIELPPLPAALKSPLIAEVAQNYARAAVEADRQEHLRDAANVIPMPTTKTEYIALLDLAIELGKKLNIAWEDALRASGQPAAPVAQEPVAYRVLRKTLGGEWKSDGRDWCDGRPSPDLVADIAKRSDGWRIEYAYAAPVSAQAQPVVNQSTERETFQRLLEYAERQLCMHEETHRGGAIWEICDQCGARWADDEGGRPEFAWPKEIEDARAALAQQESGQDREDAADMFWDADDPERFGGDNLHDTLVDLADDYGDPDFPVTVRLQCAKRLPDVQVVVTGRNDDGELVYEVIDAARAAKEVS